MTKIKVLVVDDSALTRSVLQKILSNAPDIEVVGTAMDPVIAARKIQQLRPDVVTLDLEMPRMDGLTFLRKLMKSSPMPVIVISGNSPKAGKNAIHALEYGAVEIIEKPDISTPEKLMNVSEAICESVRAAYETLGRSGYEKEHLVSSKPDFSTDITTFKTLPAEGNFSASFYVIGASTGGPDVLKAILRQLHPQSHGIVIAQHMPALFTKSFAERLDIISQISVKEAENGEYIEDGKVLIIPGNYHGRIVQDSKGYYLKLDQTEKVNRHRPSVDVLFSTAADSAGSNVSGFLLTGMGEDGVAGLLELQQKGASTIAQDEASSVVYGMPKRAVERGAAMYSLTPAQMVELINNEIKQKAS